jgi:hypothetical protein
MLRTLAATATPTITVTCADCGQPFELSARNEYGHRRRGTLPRCHACRFPPKPPSARVLAEMRRWWIARYGLEELRSWPPL